MEFALKTETERRLYIDALLHCIDHGTLTEEAVLNDLEALVTQGPGIVDASSVRAVKSRFGAVLIAYRHGSRDRDNASNVLLEEINAFARLVDPG